MYDMRMVVHAGHIGLAAKLAEMLGDALQIADTQGLVADKNYFVREQGLAQLKEAFVAQARQIEILYIRTYCAGGRGYTDIFVTRGTVVAGQGVDEFAHGSHSCCFEVITECEVTARLAMMITAKK
jgi:hypothetical protein